MRFSFPAVFLVTCGALAFGQAEPPTSQVVSTLPTITVNDQAVSLQAGLYPNLYPTTPVADDIGWVVRTDSSLVRFVQRSADSIFVALSDYSGIAWREESLLMYFVRYYPSPGSADPLIIPVGGVRVGALSEAIPAGAVLKLELIYQMAQRMLLQGLLPDAPTYSLLSNHELMQPTPLRRDNLAFLLALAVSNRILGPDSTYLAYQSPFWKRHLLGREIFDQYLYHDWKLSQDRPLTRWLAEEVADSKLVEVTDITPDQAQLVSAGRRPVIEGVPSTGRLGFSVRIGSGSQLIVDNIDNSRTGYRCGLRAGDVIRTVDGKKPGSQKQLIEMILDQID
ncbi:hypothetical protein C3F09_03995, partial [candidate division GN15 bacterium]